MVNVNLDFADVPERMAPAVRALAGAVARRERAILLGPPGAGKTMLARRVTSIMPSLNDRERTWLTIDYRASADDHPEVVERPFRAPHYTISTDALCGTLRRVHATGCKAGWCHDRDPCCERIRVPWPGELQLARFGVLFLDELPEFRTASLTSLAHAIPRMGESAPVIIAAANLCPCGWTGATGRVCICNQAQREAYTCVVKRVCVLMGITAEISVEASSAPFRDTSPRCPSSAQIAAEAGLATS